MYYKPDKKYNLFELLQKADEGDMESMSEAVSLLCAEGYIGSDNTEPDIAERYISYLEKLSKLGDSTSYIMLGGAYRKGNGVPKDLSVAKRLYERAVEEGISFGNECIGFLYYNGEGVPVDYKKAFEYFTMNESPSICTLYALGEMYRLGQYVEKNAGTACEYFGDIVYGDRKYAELDDYYWQACYRLGKALHYGDGVEKDIDKALTLIEKAKEATIYRNWRYETSKITKEELEQEWIELNCDAGEI